MGLTVVPLSDRPSLRDIPARLRRLAEQIEKGEYGDVKVALCILDCDNDRHVFGFGDNPSSLEIVGLLTVVARDFGR